MRVSRISIRRALVEENGSLEVAEHVHSIINASLRMEKAKKSGEADRWVWEIDYAVIEVFERSQL